MSGPARDLDQVASGQQDAIEDLIAAFHAQQATIETLARTVDELTRRVQALEDPPSEGADG